MPPVRSLGLQERSFPLLNYDLMPPLMPKPFELFVGLRYTRAKRRNHFISFISATSIIGIALGVTALITVLSVMNGFETELRERILGMTSHANILTYQGSLSDWQHIEKIATRNSQVAAAAPYVSGQGMLRNGSRLSGTLIRGVVPSQERDVSDVAEKMIAGKFSALKPGGYGIVLGSGLANSLGVTVGDHVDLLIPMASVTPAGILPRFRRFTVVGLFQVGMYEYDNGLVFIDMRDAQRLYRMGDHVTGVRLRLHDMFKAPQVSHQIAQHLPAGYVVRDWTQQHTNFFRAVRMEKTVMFIILSLIVAVAAFNIVSTLVMVVTDKQADIAILRTLGAAPRSIMAIFMLQGAVIGVVGTLIGVACGVALALNIETIVPWLENLLNYHFLSAQVYYISELPSKLERIDVVRITVLSLVLSLVSTIYPAFRASRVQPAEALRYE